MKKNLLLLSILFSFSEISWGLIKFTYVSPSSNEIHIKNFGTSNVNIAAYRFCALFEYVNLSDGSVSILSGDFSLSAGEEVALTWDSFNGFNTTSSDLCLYLPTGAFTSPSAMADFVQYGGGGQGRESVANSAGLWTSGTFLTGSGPWYYTGDGTLSGLDQWSSTAPIDVTFQVNMSQEIVSPNGIHMAGSMQNWDAGSSEMIDQGNGIYGITFTLFEGDYQYKFINGDNFAQTEIVPQQCGVDDGFGGFNREITVNGNSDIILDAVCFGSCNLCVNPIDIAFSVDMSNEVVSMDGVHLVGNFQNWTLPGIEMTDAGNGIYTYTSQLPANADYEYRFLNGLDYNVSEIIPSLCGVDDGFGAFNRLVVALDTDINLDTVCFSSCTMCPIEPQDINVTFVVNMNEETIDPNGVHVAGSFNSWDAASSPMTDADLDGVYTYTTMVSQNSQIFFKFINGNAWGMEEILPSECALADGLGGQARVIYPLLNDIASDTVCYGSCTNCGVIIDEPSNMITLQVNMQDVVVSPNGVHVAGNFQNWDPATFEMTDADDDGIYTITFEADEWANLSYKFINGNTWNNAEIVPSQCGLPDGNGGNNRILETGTFDFTASPVCFSSCINCDEVVEPTFVTVVFQVDMSNEIPSPQGIHIAGDFQGWNPNGTEMTELGGGIYELSYQVETNQIIHFKFINGSDWPFSEIVPAECGIEDGFGAYNRSMVIGTENAVFGPVCFSSCTTCEDVIEPATVDVTFLIDMSNEVVDANGVHIAGNFQNWNPSTSEMTDSNSDNVYEYTAAIDTNSTVLFKIINGNDWPMQETVTAECGVSDGFGGFNRSLEVAESDITFGPVCFSSCTSCISIPMVDITFQLDLGQLTADPAGVHIAGTFNGFSPTATELTLAFDNVYTATVSIPENSLVNFKYLNGETWTNVESVPFECGTDDSQGGYNRSVTVDDMDFTLPQVCFSSCSDCVVNIQDKDLNAFNVYPNPAEAELNIVFSKNPNTCLKLYDAIGNLVATYQLNSDFVKLDMTPFSAGVYSLNIPGYPTRVIAVQ